MMSTLSGSAKSGEPTSIFGQVGPPWLDTKPIAIVAGGRSLAGFDLEQLRDVAHVVAVKGMIFDLPWADIGVGSDFPRLIEWLDKLKSVSMPLYWLMVEQLWNKEKREKPENLTFIKFEYGSDVSSDPTFIYRGGTSGFGALGISILKQNKNHRKPIYLFGFDYKGDHKNFHLNDEHYVKPREQNDAQWVSWSRCYDATKGKFKLLGVTVVNASPDSLIAAYEKVTPDEALRRIRLDRV